VTLPTATADLSDSQNPSPQTPHKELLTDNNAPSRTDGPMARHAKMVDEVVLDAELLGLPQSTKNALDVCNVCMNYGDVSALSDITLSIPSGSITTLIGPNGAGKSSLVRAICGRRYIDAGTISIDGCAATKARARINLGVAPQSAALYPLLTARENLISFGRQAGMSAEQARLRIDHVLDLIGMTGRCDIQVNAMSGGMRQRVNIGAAIMHQPKLVVLDEPVSSLDPDGTRQINSLICRLRAEGFAILLITHDMDQAMSLSDQLLVLQQGRIAARGKPQDIVDLFCGTRINLFIETRDETRITDLGFKQCPERPGCWRKVVLDTSALSEEIPRLVNAGITLERLNIIPSHLGDVLAVLAKPPITTSSDENNGSNPSQGSGFGNISPRSGG